MNGEKQRFVDFVYNLDKLNAIFAAIGGWSYDHRWIVFVFAGVLLGGSLPRLNNVLKRIAT